MPDALLIGLSALDAQRRAMEVTSHNIANASTEGYSRQRADLGSPIPEEIQPGSVGRGVQVEAIRRQVDELLIERFRASHSQMGRLETLKSNLTDLELVYNEPGEGGLASVVDATFSALEDLSNNPESVALRTGVVQQLETFTSTMRQMSERVVGMRDDLSVQMDAEIVDVNRITGEIASLNQDIKRLTLIGQNPNDLLDHRDRLLNQLSERMDIRVFTEPLGRTVRVELEGSTLISASQNFPLARGTDSDGNDIVLFESGTRAKPGGGVLGALEELSGTILPAAIEDLDALAGTLINQLNEVHATGLSHTYSESLHSSAARIDTRYLDENLDDQIQVLQPNSPVGIAEAFLPSFQDATGSPVARNLTINLFDETTGSASKYTVRYEPGGSITPASRSLEDLVEAINTGEGGGFTVHPPRPGGVEGVRARAVPSSGGLRLQLQADEGFSIDFSSALDLRPVQHAWTGAAIGVSGTDAALAGGRLGFEVRAGGSQLAVFRHDPITGERTGYPGATPAIVDLTAAGPAVVNGLTITYTAGAANYSDGETFAASVDATGLVAHTESPTWTDGNAGFRISGRYTGEQTYEPGQRWGVEVLRSGLVGADADSTGADVPPIVSFSWYEGPIGAGVLQSKQVTLDENFRAGDQIRIADGVYAQFDAGRLTVGDRAAYTVDAEPDQAGLLAALGINQLLSGSGAQDVRVAEAVAADPGKLAVSSARSAGDNSNLLRLIEARGERIFGPSGTTFDEFYQSQVSEAAVRNQQATAGLTNQSLLKQSLANRRDSVSGVSIDEEVSLLIRQQQAYGAAARVISIAKENIDTLLGLIG